MKSAEFKLGSSVKMYHNSSVVNLFTFVKQVISAWFTFADFLPASITASANSNNYSYSKDLRRSLKITDS